MAVTPNSPRVKAGTLAVAALATCCGVKLALLAAAGALTAGVLGRSVAVFGLGALALVGVFFAIGRRRIKGDACAPQERPRVQEHRSRTGGHHPWL